MRRPDARRVAIAAVLVAACTAPLGAQQYITDDAAITEYRACQIQMWHGQRSSWVLPVCSPLRNIELSLGFIAVWKDGAQGHFEYVAQVKTLLRPLRPNSWGAGFVVGTGRDPAFTGTANQTYTLYSYVPASVSLSNDRLVLHENTGWLYARAAGSGSNAFTWAARGDLRLRRMIAAVGEVYGAEGIGGTSAGAPAEFQAGLRSWLRRDHVELDLTYGGALRTGRRAAGWTLGLTLITPPFL